MSFLNDFGNYDIYSLFSSLGMDGHVRVMLTLSLVELESFSLVVASLSIMAFRRS